MGNMSKVVLTKIGYYEIILSRGFKLVYYIISTCLTWQGTLFPFMNCTVIVSLLDLIMVVFWFIKIMIFILKKIDGCRGQQN